MNPMLPVMLCADTQQSVLDEIETVLGRHVRLIKARGAAETLALARNATPPHLMLVDADLGGEGLDLLGRLKDDPLTRQIPVLVMLPLEAQAGLAAQCLDLGAADLVRKPLESRLLASRVRGQLALAVHAQPAVSVQDHPTVQALERQCDALVLAIAGLVEVRDSESGNHLRRMQAYMRVLGEAMIDLGGELSELTPETLDLIVRVCPIHDIGNIAVPDSILLKPGRLKPEELAVMQQHTVFGKNVIEEAELEAGTSSLYLQTARQLVYGHHERWDGSGYPQGLKGDAIPLPARMLAVVDVYDAVISKRLYKPARSHHEALEIIVGGRGTAFDPGVVDAFMAVHDQIEAVAQRLQDTELEMQDQIALLERVVTIDRIEL